MNPLSEREKEREKARESRKKKNAVDPSLEKDMRVWNITEYGLSTSSDTNTNTTMESGRTTTTTMVMKQREGGGGGGGRGKPKRRNVAVVDGWGMLTLNSSLDFVQMLVRSGERELNTFLGIAVDLINRESHKTRIPHGIIDVKMKERCNDFTQFCGTCERCGQHVETEQRKEGERDPCGSDLLREIKRTSQNIYQDTLNIRICLVMCLVAECDAMQRLVRLGSFKSLKRFRCDLNYHPIPEASFDEYLHITKILRTVFLNGQMTAKKFAECLCATTVSGVHKYIKEVVIPARRLEAQRLAKDIDRDFQKKILLDSDEEEDEEEEEEGGGGRGGGGGEWD